MSNNNEVVTLEIDNLSNVESILNEVETAFYDIPFGNSAFQTKAFVIAASITPERAYRTIGLQLTSLLRSIRNNLIGKQIAQIKLEQKKEKLNDPTLDKFDKQILELEILSQSAENIGVNKSANDALNEFNVLYTEFKKLPKFTREQFEYAEMNYYTQSLTRQANQMDGAQQSIVNMFEDLPALNVYTEQIKSTENLDMETLTNLRLAMNNQFDNALKRVQASNQQELNTGT
jgi:hypothetical protein